MSLRSAISTLRATTRRSGTSAITCRAHSTGSYHDGARSWRRGGIGAALGLGLSLGAYYAVGMGALYADELSEQKSVDSFALGRADYEALLRRYEKTHYAPEGSGIARYDITQVESNNPSEDDHAEAFMKSDDSQWSFFGVYDGHNGWETSALLREELIEAVTKEFTGIDPAKPRTYDTDPYAEAMTRAFKSVDDKIVHERVDEVLQSKKISRSAVINLLAPAWSGSCALLAFYDAKTSMLRVALTGDCRAVLGRRRADGKFDLEVLTIDQTGKNPDEQKRVEAEHPGETVVKDGRILGWPPSRVFGDARWKWSREIQEKLKKYLGRSLVDAVKTPPYFTAEPVVSCTNMKRGDFVILATDGLWDVLTNREVVGLVGAWVHKNEGKTKTSGWWSRWWSAKSAANSLPVVGDAKSSESADKDYYGTKKEFINVDSNAATHLVRNALGGANKDK